MAAVFFWISLAIALVCAAGAGWALFAARTLTGAGRSGDHGSVFISFRRRDLEIAEAVAARLKEAGLRVTRYEPLPIDAMTAGTSRVSGREGPSYEALEQDPGATARIYYDMFFGASALIVVDPFGDAEDSAYVSAEVNIAANLGLTTCRVNRQEMTDALIPRLAATRCPSWVTPLSASYKDAISSAVGAAYANDEKIGSRDAQREAMAAVPRPYRMTVNDSPPERELGWMFAASGIILTLGACLFGVVAAALCWKYLG